MSAPASQNRRRTSSANAAPLRRSNRPKVDLICEDHPELADQILAIAGNLDLSARGAAEEISALVAPVSYGSIYTWRSRNGVGACRASQATRNEQRSAERDEEASVSDFEYDLQSGTGHITVTTQGEGTVGDLEELLVFHGLDAEKVQVVGTATISRWTTSRWNKESGVVEVIWNTSHRFRIEAIRDDSFDLPEALSLAEASVTAYSGAPARTRTIGVLAPSDGQIGKVDRRGGTQETIERAEYARKWFEEYAGNRNLAGVCIPEGGDLVEGEWSAGGLNGLVGNDLASPMKQLEVASAVMWRFVSTALQVAPRVMYAAVASNHSHWRCGGNIGNSHDDWGIAVAKQMAVYADLKNESDRFALALPSEFDESVRIQIGEDVAIGLTHGHKMRGGAAAWYARQCANANAPVANVEVLLTGHYHTPIEQIIGASSSGRPTYHNQLLSLDGGSSWYEQINGAATAAPGVLYFEIDAAEGYDPQSRRIVTAPWDRAVAPERRSSTNFFEVE